MPRSAHRKWRIVSSTDEEEVIDPILDHLADLARGVRGVRVFLSYAMPTNVQLARPLKRALESHGASVWFDQTARPDSDELAEGLRKPIAAQDVFLLCASRELFENAGYALQELAWVLNLYLDPSWRGTICVAELDDVVLPRAFDVPRVALSDLHVKLWPEAIVNLVVHARKADTPVMAPDRLTVDQPVASLRELELEDLRLRARHMDAWWRLDEGALARALTRSSVYATKSPEYQALCETIRRLKWDGALANYDMAIRSRGSGRARQTGRDRHAVPDLRNRSGQAAFKDRLGSRRGVACRMADSVNRRSCRCGLAR